MPLHPQAADFVRILAEQNAPGWHELPPEQSRLMFNNLIEPFGSKPQLHEVVDLNLSGIPCRLYRPEVEEDLPAVVYFHGGGWVLGNIETHDALCRQLAIAAQCCVLSVDYRLAPETRYPGPLEDCFAATRGLFERAAELGIDAGRISVAGDSAGGNLAVAVALRARDAGGPPIRSQILIYPVVEPNFETQSYNDFAADHGLTRDSMEWFWKQYVGNDLGQAAEDANLALAGLNGLPPAMVLTAEFDVLRDEGEAFSRRLAEAGVAVNAKRYPGMLHGFVHLSSFFDDAQTAFHDIAAYLRD